MYVHKNARNVLSGWGLFNPASQLSSIMMLLLAPFAASVEVFVRKDMGERYFNYVNFMGGFFCLTLMRVIYALSGMGFSLFSGAGTPPATSIVSLNWFRLVWFAYILMGLYHFFYQWYREATQKPLHSFYLGDSRLFFLGKIIYGLVNQFFPKFIEIIARFLPEHEKEELLKYDTRLQDYKAFTYMVLEPAAFILFGWYFWVVSGLVGFWAVVSGLMLLFHSSTTLMKERHEFLDMRDGQIFAEQIQLALEDKSDTLRVSDNVKQTMYKMAEQAAENPSMMEDIKSDSPSVAEVLANLRAKKQAQPQETILNAHS